MSLSVGLYRPLPNGNHYRTFFVAFVPDHWRSILPFFATAVVAAVAAVAAIVATPTIIPATAPLLHGDRGKLHRITVSAELWG